MKSCLLTICLFFAFTVASGAWQTSAPFTKQEIFSLLREADVHRISQADIAAEINQRGIGFPVDEKTLDQFRQAGARTFLLDAIKQAGKNVGKPRLSDPELDNDNSGKTLPLLEEARRHALEFAEELPNFIVTQIVTRYVRAPEKRDWQLDDKLEIEVTYRVGKGEEFKLLRVNGAAARESYEHIAGSTSTGEFGSLLAGLFLPQSKAEFKEVKRETFQGRSTVVYDFKVRRANSTNSVSDKSSGAQTVAGYSGSVWIDTETKRVLRVEESHDEIPAGFPVTLSENAVEYDWITIAGQRYLLPIRAEVLLGRDDQRIYTKNVIEFRGYRKFEARIKLDPN
ncbi:MAG TPA: hypothetical protein VKF81_04960 [Blastocatellia bacterium]|nr:hypothetical protein [Blastocatellia bacterium]